MLSIRLIAPALAFIALSALSVPSRAAASIDGLWLTKDGEGIVEIAPCASDSANKCGKIVWMKTPTDEEGKPLRDQRNPDAALQRRPICMLTILSDLKPVGGDAFDKGIIYDPEEGKTYTGAIKLEGDQLRVTGTVGLAVIDVSDSEVWTPMKKPFARCAPK